MSCTCNLGKTENMAELFKQRLVSKISESKTVESAYVVCDSCGEEYIPECYCDKCLAIKNSEGSEEYSLTFWKLNRYLTDQLNICIGSNNGAGLITIMNVLHTNWHKMTYAQQSAIVEILFGKS